MDERKSYQVQLYYGFQETEDGIYHAFEATDPEGAPDDKVPERLAELLDTTTSDDRFDYNLMPIRLPDSLVDRIRNEAVQEYMEYVSECLKSWTANRSVWRPTRRLAPQDREDGET